MVLSAELKTSSNKKKKKNQKAENNEKREKIGFSGEILVPTIIEIQLYLAFPQLLNYLHCFDCMNVE